MSLVAALDFTDKHILVCGGSDGIGYGVATAFYEVGATVSITGTRSADSYDNDFSHFTYYQLDVQDEAFHGDEFAIQRKWIAPYSSWFHPLRNV